MFDLTANPWRVLTTDFPATEAPDQQLHFLLNYAVLAPSEYNTQPWLFKVIERNVEIYADSSRCLPMVDPDNREMTISCGAAFLNLRIALRHFGYKDEVDRNCDDGTSDLLARVHLGERKKATQEEQKLFYAILRRRTNRHPFEDREVEPSLLSSLKEIAGQEGTWFHVVRGEEARHAVADLIATGDRVQWADWRFRRELASWTRPRGFESHDGLPGYAQSKGNFAASISPFMVRTFDMGNGEAAKDRQLVEGSPVLAVLGTLTDTRRDWFAAGQTVERILLYARSEEVWASFVNQPIEIPALRAHLRAIVGSEGFPQLVLRMGYGKEVPPTPRRSVSEVLLSH